jgi:hypothetical protein
MMRRHRAVLSALLFAAAFGGPPLFGAHRVAAQMRPLDPPMFRAFDGDANLLLSAGAGFLGNQRASLPGTRGRLEELGLYNITWRSGRIALTAAGTAIVRMTNETRVESALSGVGERHEDAGPVLLETSARLSPDDAPLLWLLRFGTRLPITSLVSGLDRDEADFFATLGLRSQGPLWVAGEAGTTINGRPEPFLGQTDFVAFSVGAGYRGARFPVRVEAWLVGQDDLHPKRFRGTEDLSELRVGARTRGRSWIGAQWVHGFGEFSPGDGIRISAGVDAHVAKVPLLGWK